MFSCLRVIRYWNLSQNIRVKLPVVIMCLQPVRKCVLSNITVSSPNHRFQPWNSSPNTSQHILTHPNTHPNTTMRIFSLKMMYLVCNVRNVCSAFNVILLTQLTSIVRPRRIESTVGSLDGSMSFNGCDRGPCWIDLGWNRLPFPAVAVCTYI